MTEARATNPFARRPPEERPELPDERSADIPRYRHPDAAHTGRKFSGKVRRASLSDRYDCVELASRSKWTRSFTAPWFSGIESFEDHVLVADEGGGVAGFCSANFLRRSGRVNLEFIAVAVPGTGCGSALVRELQSRVRLSMTHTVIRTRVTPGTMGFWIKMGFEPDGAATAVWST